MRKKRNKRLARSVENRGTAGEAIEHYSRRAQARHDRMNMETIESLIRDWDGETVVSRFDRATGAWIFIAIHSTLLGPAGGGTRMKIYGSPVQGLADGLQLAAAMTKKFAVPALPYGGGKAVICLPSELAPMQRTGLLQRYASLVKQLGGTYQTGPDVGIGEVDMDVIDEIAAPYVFGKSAVRGGSGNSGAVTAAGVFAGIEVACEQVLGSIDLRGRSVLVQGSGSVGLALIQMLCAAGARVLFHEIDTPLADRLQAEMPQLERVAAEAVYETSCDVFSPCALGGVLNRHTIPRLQCRAVVGAANNQLGDVHAARRLHERGILYAPDFVVNVGGAMGLLGMELRGWSPQRAGEEVAQSVRKALREVFAIALSGAGNTADAADFVAQRHLATARAGRVLATH